MGCNYDYNCCNCQCYKECDDENKQVVVEAMTKEDMLTFWEILKQKFADILHKHDMSDIETGVLPVDKGGTGAENAEDALANLGGAEADHTHHVSAIDEFDDNILPIANGGTGLSQNPMSLTNLESNAEDDILKLHSTPGVTGVLGEEHGGTGANTFDTARANLHVPGAWDGTNAVVSLAEGGLGVSCSDAAEARAAIDAAAENHTHSAGDIDDGVLGIGHGGTGANNAEDALANLGGAPYDHKHLAVATISVVNSNPSITNVDDVSDLDDGFIPFNTYLAPLPSGDNKIQDGKAETPSALICMNDGVYLISGQVNYQPSDPGTSPAHLETAMAIVRNRGGVAEVIARSMMTADQRGTGTYDNLSLAVPMQFVQLQSGDKLCMYVSQKGRVKTPTGASLTAMYVASGIWTS